MSEEPRFANIYGHVPATTDEYLKSAFNYLPYALALPFVPAGLYTVARALYDFHSTHKILYTFVGTHRARLCSGYPIGLLRIEGPLTKILTGVGAPPELLLKEEGEQTNMGAHYSPQLFLGLHIWARKMMVELHAARKESRPPRCMLYTGEIMDIQEWLQCPPALPYCMVSPTHPYSNSLTKLPEAYEELGPVLRGRTFKNLGQLIDAINEAKIDMGTDGQRFQLWAHGPRDTCNHERVVWSGERRFGARTERRFGIHWADVLVGNIKVEHAGCVPSSVKAVVSAMQLVRLTVLALSRSQLGLPHEGASGT